MGFPLIDVIERHASDTPIAPALIGLGGYLTYADLFRCIVIIANHLDDRRLPRGSRTLINIANPDLRLVVLLAAIDYGLIPLIAQPDTLRADYPWEFVIGSPEPVWLNVPQDISIDESVLAGRFADTRRRSFPERSDDDVAMVVETSGTTGRPKLVAVIYDTMKGPDQGFDAGLFRPSDRVLTSIGAATKYGIRVSCRALIDGAAVVSAPSDPTVVVRLINLFRVTYLLTTPVFIDRTVELMEAHNIRCDTVERIRITGATFTPELIRRIENRLRATIVVAYGTSETNGGIANGRVSSATYVKGYVGKVSPELKLVTTGTKANPGRIILVNDRKHFAHSISKGKIIEHTQPFFELPDMGYVEDSILYLTGRSDEVYNFSGSIKAYSLIEEVVRRLVRAKDIGIVNGSALGHDLDLVIGIVSDDRIDLEPLAVRLAEALGMVEARRHLKLVQLPAVPRNHQTGKIDRKALLEDYRNRNSVRA